MADGEKRMHFANFNITFGKDEDPMLTHFEDIIFPAFCSGIKRSIKGKRPIFYVDDVEIKFYNSELVMVGNYIKDAEYDIHTTIQNGELKSTPITVPTAPYSRFLIFLKNHRMILVRNEAQSPDIRSFQATIREIVNEFIHRHNRDEKNKEKQFPPAVINVVDMHLKKEIEVVLKDVQKINWLRLRFFPLNNDINPIPVAENIDKEMKKLGCKRAAIQFRKPESKREINNLIACSSGLAESTMEVIDSNGNKTTIKDQNFKSSTTIPLEGDITPRDDEYFIEQGKKNEMMNVVSVENLKIYKRFKMAIKKLMQ